jgi:AcrR family transcriptional regulator
MKTKQKILNAALKVLGEQGYQALTQTRVAEVAGLRQGLLTYHFPTRSDLLKAVVDASKAQMAARDGVMNATISIDQLRDFALEFALSKSLPRIMLALSVAADEDASLASWFVEADRSTRQHIRCVLTQLALQVDELELHLLRATIVGASLINLQQNTAESERVARDVVAAAFVRLKNNTQPL